MPCVDEAAERQNQSDALSWHAALQCHREEMNEEKLHILARLHVPERLLLLGEKRCVCKDRLLHGCVAPAIGAQCENMYLAAP